MFLQYSTKYVITQIVITKSVNTFCVLYKVEEMTDIINEDVKYTSAWYMCIKFYTFAGCFSLFTITEIVVLVNS